MSDPIQLPVPPGTVQLPVPEFKLFHNGTKWVQKEFGT